MIKPEIILAAYKFRIDEGSLYQPTKSDDTLLGVIRTAIFWATVVAVVAVVIAGFTYTLSQGDPGKVAQAKNAILYAIVGLVVVLAAAGIILSVYMSFPD